MKGDRERGRRRERRRYIDKGIERDTKRSRSRERVRERKRLRNEEKLIEGEEREGFISIHIAMQVCHFLFVERCVLKLSSSSSSAYSTIAVCHAERKHKRMPRSRRHILCNDT